MDMVDGQLPVRGQLAQIPAQRSDVLDQLFRRLLEGHKQARLTVLQGTANQELHRQQRLARTGTATDQRGPATQCDVIQPPNPRGGL